MVTRYCQLKHVIQDLSILTRTIARERITKLFRRNTSSPSITIERKNLFMNRSASIWIAVNYAHASCVKGRNISVIPRKAGKCLTPSNINAHQITKQLVIKWNMPTAPTEYELRYREAHAGAPQWTKVMQSENTIGYYIDVERIPNSCRDSPNRIIQKDRKVLLNLSMAYHRINISAYNKAGQSPQTIYIVPDFSATDLPGQINVKPQGTNVVVTWIPEHSPKCFVVDWGTGKEDMRMKIVATADGNFTLGKSNSHISSCRHHFTCQFYYFLSICFPDNINPYKLYKIMVHASDVCQCESFRRHEKTLGVTHFYSVEGVPRIGPSNITIMNITKHSAFVKWTEISAEDSMGFLQGYKINYIDSSRKKFLAASINSSTTSYHLTGLKEKTIYSVQISGFTKAGEGSPSFSQPFSTLKYGTVESVCYCVAQKQSWLYTPFHKSNWKPISKSLLQTLPDNDTTSLYVIEHEGKASLKLEHFIDGVEDCKHGISESEEPSNNIGINITRKEIPEEMVTSEKDGIISITVPLLSDYTSMECSQKALMSLTVKLPARTAHPHLEMELSNKIAQTEHQVLFAPQDYLKQSQVVFLPSGPTLMRKVTLN
ncbi:UNVERIFIED_CONTAM: hypothetical protein H355_016885 [Colinus virginianus]|nr:hypothetical protein H355_016885 [Colinus virginianus]